MKFFRRWGEGKKYAVFYDTFNILNEIHELEKMGLIITRKEKKTFNILHEIPWLAIPFV